MKNVFYCIIIFFLSSCRPTQELIVIQTHKEVMDEQCENKNKSEILIKLGAPDRTTDDGNNGEILVFDESYVKTYTQGRSNTSVYEIFGVPRASTKISKTSTNKKVKQEINFFIDENKQCYHWKTIGWDFTKYEHLFLEENARKNVMEIKILGLGGIISFAIFLSLNQ